MATVAELDKLYPNHYWRYTSALVKVKHAVPKGVGDTSDPMGPTPHRSAECGNGPAWFSLGWLGTGSQEEYERLDQLRECKRCMDRLTIGGQSHRMPGGSLHTPSPEERRGGVQPDLHAGHGAEDARPGVPGF